MKIEVKTKEEVMCLLKPLVKKYCDPFLEEKYPDANFFVKEFDYGEGSNRLYTFGGLADTTSWNWLRIENEKSLSELVEIFNKLSILKIEYKYK